jgi:hypothetical protein
MEPVVHLTGLAASTRTAAGQVQPSRRRPRRSAADALRTQRDHASFFIDRGADYLLVVKANQPALHAQLAGLPWRKIPVMDRTRDHGHGRVEVRTLKVAAVAGLCFPHAAQGIQATRRVRASGSRRWRSVTVYAITSLALGTASPARWPAGFAGTGRSRTGCTGSAT